MPLDPDSDRRSVNQSMDKNEDIFMFFDAGCKQAIFVFKKIEPVTFSFLGRRNINAEVSDSRSH